MVDRIARPSGVFYGGKRGTLRRNERPVRLPFGALFDPRTQGGDISFGEGPFSGVGRRHAERGLRVRDASDDFARCWIAGDDGCARAAGSFGAGFGVEAEVGFARRLVGSVAGEAPVGKE